jgi:aryl-alcohol dehydrogenase-like predicted oxidoreductase
MTGTTTGTTRDLGTERVGSRDLGRTGPMVSSLGLGLMGMSDLYGTADEAESITTVHAALDAGVTLLDTGDFYGAGHNEMLLRDALRGRNRDDAVISVKFGALRDPAAQGADIVPLVGARRRDRLAESLAAAQVTLTAAALAAVEKVVPAGAAAGTRYAAPLMNELDSER